MQAQAVQSIRLIGKRPSLDFRVDHEDHNFYAEGVVVSNSHAVMYSYLTAVTVYLKKHYPQAFYLTMLKLANEEPNPIEYMNSIIAEMRANGIKLLPPDLIKSDADFSIQDGHVRFGLAHVKGISEITMAKVASFKREFENKFDIFNAAKAAKVDIRVLTGLIMSGCLDSIITDGSSRAKLVLEAQLYNLLTDNEKLLVKKYAPEYNYNLVDLIKGVSEKKNEKGKSLIRDTRLATLRRDYADYWNVYQANSKNEELTMYISERHYLGFSYTTTLYDVFNKRVVGLTPIKEILEKKNEDKYKFVAFVGESKMHISAKGSPYWKGMLYDDSNTVFAMLHGEEKVGACKSFNGDVPKDGDIVTVSGALSKDGKIIFCESIVIQPNPIKMKRGDKET